MSLFGKGDGKSALQDVPIGINAKGERTETDSMGSIKVPADRYWGAQTQRSLLHFSIGEDRMPKRVYHAYGFVKKAAALVNSKNGRLPEDKAAAIIQAAEEAIAGKLDENFPLFVWQTGSGTQSNMNVNEVLSNRAIQLLGGKLGAKAPVHPNDHVNLGQSSNDTFPTAMHLAAVQELNETLIPQVEALIKTIEVKAADWRDEVKIGRTHLEDAVPLTVGQEWSGYAAQLRFALDAVEASKKGLYELAAGGTAVGTGLNSFPGFSKDIAAEIAELTGLPFVTAPNKFFAQGSLDPIVAAHAALRGLAVALMKIANDLRWLASGPRCGLGELILPANEPGSSIMTVFASGAAARTFDYQAGDVGYVPLSMPHYVQNTGTETLRFLEAFASDHYADVSLNQWLALSPPELVQQTLQVAEGVVRGLKKVKQAIVKS